MCQESKPGTGSYVLTYVYVALPTLVGVWLIALMLWWLIECIYMYVHTVQVSHQRFSELTDCVMAEVDLPETGPGEGGGVISPTPDEDILHGHQATALDDQTAHLRPQSRQTSHH